MNLCRTVETILLLLFVMLFPTVLSDNPEMPSELTISISDYTPNIGDVVTVTLTEIPYEPDMDYVRFGANVYYGDKKEGMMHPWEEEDYILRDWGALGVAISGNRYQSSFSFIPDDEGDITIDVHAHRQYDVTFVDVQIHSYSEILSQNGNGMPIGFGTIMLLAFGIFLIIVMIITYIFFKKKRMKLMKQRTEKTILMFCPKCSIQLTNEINFCGNCGTKLK